jgi:hypothetical protein
MQNKKPILLWIVLLFLGTSSIAQSIPSETQRVHGVVFQGDTIPYVFLRPVKISGKRSFKNSDDEARYRKLVYNVNKVWPYARLAGEKYNSLKASLSEVDKRRDRKKIIKETEAYIKENLEDQLKKLTISQGEILIKLIDRQTGETSYFLLKNLKSGFSAATWQGMAKLFGHDLKSKYDPLVDYEIESIVQSLEEKDFLESLNQK